MYNLLKDTISFDINSLVWINYSLNLSKVYGIKLIVIVHGQLQYNINYFLFCQNFGKLLALNVLKFQEFKQLELNPRLIQSNALILNKLTKRIIGG